MAKKWEQWDQSECDASQGSTIYCHIFGLMRFLANQMIRPFVVRSCHPNHIIYRTLVKIYATERRPQKQAQYIFSTNFSFHPVYIKLAHFRK